jgi:predicted metal-dependent phosphoesterase TrpH
LKEYKLHNPEIFIIAPHPFFDFLNSISKKKLIEFIDIFDAIEHSWFYSKYYNLNERVGILAKRFKKPFISTADVHFLEYLEEDYIVLECEELSEKSVFEAIRDFRYENKTSPKKFFGLVRVFLKMIYLNIKPII